MLKITLAAALLFAPLLRIAPANAQNRLPALASPIPDVSDLEYREVTLARAPIFVRGARSLPQPAVHLWVLPAQNGETRRGIGWDGVEYELKSVGNRADWRADVEAALKPRVEGERYFFPRPFEFSGAPVSQLFLDRLGAPELRRRVRLGRSGRGSDDPDADYQKNLRGAGVSAFASGDFLEAKRQLQTLLAALTSEKSPDAPSPREEATLILGDIARRENDAPRPTEEIAGLIWDLQNVRAHQFSSPGDIGWTQDRTVQKLIDAGDRAVEPLLETLENDERLTLSVRHSRGEWRRPGSLGTVRDAAHNTLNHLLKHLYYTTNYRQNPTEQRRQLAAQMRADWEKIKGQTPTERIFQTLSQSGQTPDRLEEAARELVRIGKPYFSSTVYVEQKNGVYQPVSEPQTFFGEPLRSRRNPSVSDLLEARILELSSRALSGKPSANALDPTLPTNVNQPDAYTFNRAMSAANALAVFEAKWESGRAAPLLGAQLERAKTFAAKAPRGVREDAENSVQRARRQFLSARLNTPFRAAALREYGQFLRSQPFGRVSKANYAPLWLFPTEPAMVEASRALFEAPKTPFQSATQWKTGDFDYDAAFRLLNSPLVKTPIFKAAIARELGNKTPVATLRATKSGEAEIRVTEWNWSGQTVKLGAMQLENGTSQPLRVCDLVGFWLQENRPSPDGQDRFYPALDVSLPTAERDARLKQIGVLVAQGRVGVDDFGFNDLN